MLSGRSFCKGEEAALPGEAERLVSIAERLESEDSIALDPLRFLSFFDFLAGIDHSSLALDDWIVGFGHIHLDAGSFGWGSVICAARNIGVYG